MNDRLGFRPASDGGAAIVDDATFRLLVDLETRKAQRLRYWVSVVCMDVERPSSGSSETAESLLRKIAPAIRATDVVAKRDDSSVSVLLVDAEASSLPNILQRVTSRLETTAWSAGGACYPKTAASAGELVDQATSMMTKAKRDGGHRFYLPSP